MIDFLKNNPYVTREEYLWKWTVPQVNLASYDFTHVRNLPRSKTRKGSKGSKKAKRYDNPDDVIMDLSLPKI